MLRGFHPDGEELRNNLLLSPSGPGIIALPEAPVKVRPCGWLVCAPSGSESRNSPKPCPFGKGKLFLS